MKREKLIKLFLGAASIKFGGRALSIVVGVMFARLLEPIEYGRYSFILSIISLATLLPMAGIPQLLLRDVPRYKQNNDDAKLLGLMKWTLNYSIILSIVSMIIVFSLAYYDFFGDGLITIIMFAVLIIPMKSVLMRWQAIINGFQKPVLAQVPIIVLLPLVSLFFVGVWFCFFEKLTSEYLMLLQVAVYFFVLVITCVFLNKNSLINKSVKPVLEVSRWRSSLVPFSLTYIIGTMNNELATLMLGLTTDEQEVAYFRVAVQAITVLVMGLQVVNIIIAPEVSRLFFDDNKVELQKLLTKSVRLSFVVSFPIIIILLFFGKDVVSLLFGSLYDPSYYLIVCLCFGQSVNVLFGSVGLVLNMTGNERAALRTQFFSMLLTFVLIIFLVPKYNSLGASISISLGLVCWNLLMAFDVYKLTGLKTWLR